MALKLGQHVGSIAMVLLAVGVGAYLYVDRGTITDRERGDRQHDVFPAYRRADIDFIELARGVGEEGKVRIERRRETRDARGAHDPDDAYWQMTSPVDERADPAAVDRFVGDLEFAGAIRKVDPGATEVGRTFDPPRLRGTLAMKSLVYHFALGGPAPVPEGAAYFRVDGEGTFVISKDFAASILNGADAYRDRSIVPYLSLDLSGLQITSRSGVVEVTRADDVSFKLKNGLRASRDGMDKVWGALAEARAESFLTDAEADRALGAAPVRVVMTPKDASRPKGELLLGGVCPGHPDDIVLVRTSPRRESACVPKGALAGLSLSESALIDRRLFASRVDEAEELTLETVPSGSFSVELARKGRGWHERKPADRELGPTEVELVNDLVQKLTRTDATDVEALAGRDGGADAAPAFAARARATLKRGNSSVDEVVELAGMERVRRTFDGAILRVPASLGRRLWPSEIVLRGRSVFPEALNVGLPVALSVDCDGVRESLAHEAGPPGAAAPRPGRPPKPPGPAEQSGLWTMKEPRGFAADALAASDVAALIRNAQVESWVADHDDGTFGLGDSACRMELTTVGAGLDAGGPHTMGIVFGREAGEAGEASPSSSASTARGFYARATADDAVFIASRALREGATTWLVDRSGFRFDKQAIERVTLSRGQGRGAGGAHVTFLGPAARGNAPGSGEASEAHREDVTARVLDALEALRPEAAVHLGPPKPAEGFASPALDVRVTVAGDAGASGSAHEDRNVHFVVGDTALLNRERVVYLRLDGVDATFAAARERISALLDAL